MTFSGLKIEYSLEGISNFIAWKDHVEEVFNENGLLKYIKRDVTEPRESYAHNLAQWEKDVAKVSRVILEGVLDHIATNIHGEENPYTMW